MAETKTKANKNEREYVIPLRPEWRKVPRYQKTNKAVKAIKEFVVRHMKIRDRDLNKVKVDKFLNEILWSRGIRHPPTKIKVKVKRDGDIVRVEAVDIPENIKFKKERMDKIDAKAMEIVQSKKSTMEKLKEAATGATSGKKSETSEAGEQVETTEEEKEKEEKKASVVEAEQKIEKEISKAQKHTEKVKTEKQSKGQRTGYNATSRGK